ncbi:hypothetical protein Nepgr_016446 [Nepenthes gracilis]|uniref:Uncharacterized protein n=1 Tax=Nepenthes gracilis TaxID=150966 RepID=A0AAD3SPT1_NEPGR|nr:hypothetical protein Nepgr_016446 [Nepenthes gracilis]
MRDPACRLFHGLQEVLTPRCGAVISWPDGSCLVALALSYFCVVPPHKCALDLGGLFSHVAHPCCSRRWRLFLVEGRAPLGWKS